MPPWQCCIFISGLFRVPEKQRARGSINIVYLGSCLSWGAGAPWWPPHPHQVVLHFEGLVQPLFRGIWGTSALPPHCPARRLGSTLPGLGAAGLTEATREHKLVAGWAPSPVYRLIYVTFCIFWGQGSPYIIAEGRTGKWGETSIKYLNIGKLIY